MSIEAFKHSSTAKKNTLFSISDLIKCIRYFLWIETSKHGACFIGRHKKKKKRYVWLLWRQQQHHRTNTNFAVGSRCAWLANHGDKVQEKHVTPAVTSRNVVTLTGNNMSVCSQSCDVITIITYSFVIGASGIKHAPAPNRTIVVFD